MTTQIMMLSLGELFINDPIRNEEFRKFTEIAGVRLNTVFVCNVLVLVVNGYFWFDYFSTISIKFSYDYMFTVAVAVSIISWILRLLSLYLIKIKKIENAIVILIENIGIFCLIFYGEINLIGRSLNGPCDNVTLSYQWKCSPQYDVKAVPGSSLIFLMLTPLFISAVFSAKFKLTLTIWISSILSIAASIVIGSFTSSIFIVVIYTVSSFVILIEMRRHNLSNFFKSEELKFLLSENERLAEESLANELRHMIGNVAHDLKTVLFFYFILFTFFNKLNSLI
jgi:hypothetical protein